MSIDSETEVIDIIKGLYRNADIAFIDNSNDDYVGDIAYCHNGKYDLTKQNIYSSSCHSDTKIKIYNSDDLFNLFVPINLSGRKIAIPVKSWMLHSRQTTLVEFRRKLLEAGVIESIISTIDTLYQDSFTRVSPWDKDDSIIVFSENNESVRLRYHNLMNNEAKQIDCKNSDLLNDERCVLFSTILMAKKRLANYKYKLKDIAFVKQGYNLSRSNLINKELIQDTKDYSDDALLGPINQNGDNVNNDYKYLVHMNNIESTVILHNIAPIRSENNNCLELSRLQPNDVLLTIRGVKLKSALVDPDDTRNLYATSDMCIIRPKVGVPGIYILAMLQSDLLTNHLLLCNPLVTLRVSEIKNIPINCNDPHDTEWMSRIAKGFELSRRGLVNAVRSSELSLQQMKESVNAAVNQDVRSQIEYAAISLK